MEPTSSGTPSSPTTTMNLHGILKRQHPADALQRDRIVSPVEGDFSSLSVGDNSTSSSVAPSVRIDTASGTGTSSEVTTLAGDGSSASIAGSSRTGGGGGGRRSSSRNKFQRRVGFNTFASGVALEGRPTVTGGGTGVAYSFTLSAKSADYKRSRWSRTFLVATDLNEYSVNATDWLLDYFLEDCDEVVVLRVIEPTTSAQTGFDAITRDARTEAEGVLDYLMKKNGEERQISLIVEFAIGPIEETIHRMIEIYKPDSLIVGTRGRPDSLFKSAFMGSISRWAVARSPVPVVVVRPDDKVREGLERRLGDSKRGRSYVSLLTEEERKRFLPPSGSSLSSLLSPLSPVSTRHLAPGHASAVSSALSGAPLERTVTAPEASERSDRGGGGDSESDEDDDEGALARKRAQLAASKNSNSSSSHSGGGLRAAFGFGKKKKDKGKEFKKFGTFS
ncbi:hypothetical protein JCM10908_005114 [Rhodotorula pacifica]|uniref:universal stress protein n=1 Tax=Rhodotorula pacifica TaxID=1495444 RepID=UPI00317A7086